MDKAQRNYLIVGGTSGIGLAAVRQLAGSANVTVWSRQASGDLPSGVNHDVWDATSGTQPPRVPDRLDGLAYCPGSIRLKPLSRLTDGDFRSDFEINCLGAVRAVRACLPALRRAPDPAVVLFSTVAVSQGIPLHASVAAAKGAVEGITRSLAAELAPRIRVNAIAPSLVTTPLSAALTGSEERREKAAKRHPMQRIAQSEEIGAAAADLLTGRWGWMTGQVIHLDGGLSSVRLLA